MPHRLIAKLEHFTPLSQTDREALRSIVLRRRKVQPREDIAREREGPGPICVILDGWACRYRQLEDGRRQIVSICLPGDVCGSPVRALVEADHSIAALTPATVAELAPARLAEVIARHPRIERALAWDAQVEMSIQREWTVNLGQRDAFERLSHLFCELSTRLEAVGLMQADGCEMPLRQSDLAAAMGLTSVHVNRSLQTLRARGLVTLKGRRLSILNFDLLRRVSLFDAHYLHLDRRTCDLGADEAAHLRVHHGTQDSLV